MLAIALATLAQPVQARHLWWSLW